MGGKFYIDMTINNEAYDLESDRTLKRLVVVLSDELNVIPANHVFVLPFNPYVKYTREEIANFFKGIADKIKSGD